MTHILEFVCVLDMKCNPSNVSLWRESETWEVFEDKRNRITQAVYPELIWLI